MNHTDAVRTEAVERYLLGQMPEDEQGIFEEHYFDCPICGADVTAGTRMMTAGRVVASEDPKTWNVVPMPKRFPWFPAAAAAALICAVLGAGYLLPLRQKHVDARAVRIDTGVLRGGGTAAIPVVRRGDELKFDVQPGEGAVEYVADVTCSGKTESTQRISREEAADTVTLRIGELPAGRCELVIQGVRKDGKRFGITSSPFEVER